MLYHNISFSVWAFIKVLLASPQDACWLSARDRAGKKTDSSDWRRERKRSQRCPLHFWDELGVVVCSSVKPRRRRRDLLVSFRWNESHVSHGFSLSHLCTNPVGVCCWLRNERFVSPLWLEEETEAQSAATSGRPRCQGDVLVSIWWWWWRRWW